MDDFEEAVETGTLETFLKQDMHLDDPNQSIGDAEIDRLMREMTDQDLDQLAGHLSISEEPDFDVGSGSVLSGLGAVTAGAATGAAVGATAGLTKEPKERKSVKPQATEKADAGAAQQSETSIEETEPTKEAQVAKETTASTGNKAKHPEPLHPKEKSAEVSGEHTAASNTESTKPTTVATETSLEQSPTSIKTESPAEPAPTPAVPVQDPALAVLIEESASRIHARSPTEEMQSRAAALAAADAALREMQEDEDDYAAPDERAKDVKPPLDTKAPHPLHPVEKEGSPVSPQKDYTDTPGTSTTEPHTDAEIELAAQEAASRAAARTDIEQGRTSTPVLPSDKTSKVEEPASDKPTTTPSTSHTDAEIELAAQEAASRAAARTDIKEGKISTPVLPSDKDIQTKSSAKDTEATKTAAADKTTKEPATGILGAAEAALASAAGAVTQAVESAVSSVADIPKAAEKFADEASGIDAEDRKAEPKVDGPAPGEKTLDEVIDETMAKEKKEAEAEEKKAL